MEYAPQFIAFVMAVGLWVATYAYMLRTTRPTPVEPDPPHQDLPGNEPPAVVSLVTNRWRLSEDAVESTLLDLAARRWIELRQPGADPLETTVHLLPEPESSRRQPLNRYEQQVLDWVQSVSHNRVAPISALTFRDKGEARRWNLTFKAAVVQEARDRGLSRHRFSRDLLVLLLVGACVPAAMATWGFASFGHPGSLWYGIVLYFVLFVLAARDLGERDTAAGRLAARRWLGLRQFLRNDEAFAVLPPASVTVWDRYLPYGAALGVTRVTSTVLDLGMGDRTRVWSAYTGQWRQLRISYPRPIGIGRDTASILQAAALQAGVAGAALAFTVRTASSANPATSTNPVEAQNVELWQSDMNPAVEVLIATIAIVILVRAGYRVVRALQERAHPLVITGQVLWLEEWSVKNESQKIANHHLVVDDGTADEIRAWVLPGELTPEVRVNEVVRIEVRPWSRRVLSVTMVYA